MHQHEASGCDWQQTIIEKIETFNINSCELKIFHQRMQAHHPSYDHHSGYGQSEIASQKRFIEKNPGFHGICLDLVPVYLVQYGDAGCNDCKQ